MVEFVLIAPFLFFIFFGIIQLAYMAYVSLAVQRAALAVARSTSLSNPYNVLSFKTQMVVSLLPIASLNRQTLFTILDSECDVKLSDDQKTVTARVRYPMPVWVPLVGKAFGETLAPAHDYNDTPEGKAVKAIFQMLNKTPPDLSFGGAQVPVIWINYEESTFNEGYGY